MVRSQKNPSLESMRHSCAHLLAAAIQQLYPTTKFGIGPVTKSGFYYDFELPKSITEADLPKIEEKMKQLKKQNLPFENFELPIDQALKEVKQSGQIYKAELIEQIKNTGDTSVVDKEAFVAALGKTGQIPKKVSFYRLRDFVDLCRGPHIKTTSEVGPFKLLSIAGAYWRGSEKNKMLTRVYGTCFETQAQLNEYLQDLEEAKMRDHRKLGQELELFSSSDEVGSGLILWLPKGTIIKEELEKFAKETEKADGYQRISTPHIAKESLYYRSGHLPYYAQDMYPPMKAEDATYYLKPMNCPHSHLIYQAKKRSYKEFPIRFAEFGTVYRYEDSGTLMGLLRVRGMTQNDAHIYCADESQALDEIVKVIKLHQYYYKIFGIKNYYIELALPDFENKQDKYFDNPKSWQESIEILRKASKKLKIEVVEKVGQAAFYAPKFDFNIKSVIGKEFGASTNQLDFGSGERFNLTYTGKSGLEKVVPYIIHRAPLGSDERFIGFLIEHFGGAFPTWLSPVQAVVVPISEKILSYAKKVTDTLNNQALRVELDERAETMQAKVRDATLEKIPYILVVGEREKQQNGVAVRNRDGKDWGVVDLDDFILKLKKKIEQRN